MTNSGQIVYAKQPGAPARLRCEYQVNPLGLDTRQPRLSWQVNDNRRGARQTAYHVIAASGIELLKAGRADLWDTGLVSSDQSVHVVYAGGPLQPRQQCFWKVRTWEADGKPSSWSEIATWEMALLSPDDWKARWIEPAEMVN